MKKIDLNGDKQEVFKTVLDFLTAAGYKIVSTDSNRPWGGFFVIDESQAGKFASQFFQGIEADSLKIGGKLSPKILMVQPDKRLSWQYHHRRAEIWKLIGGVAGVITSDTDKEGELHKLSIGEIIRLNQGERHRLIGTEGWGMVAEIWQHTDPKNPSNEEDIVRVQDDFGR
jgi:mannose-6-phosphate isomerase-like protein (cupin superfamily)